MTEFIKRIKTALIEYIFTVRCPYCGCAISRNHYACEKCLAQFPYPPEISYAIGGYKCVSPFRYTDIFKKAVINFKFYGKASMAKELSFPMATAIKNIYADKNIDIVTCVPSHKSTLKKRGYNQAQRLAIECAERLGITYKDTLLKTKKNLPQHSISSAKRGDNVKGVYKICNKDLVQGKTILIIDDIITTGNTLGECSKILIKNGCKEVLCATLCSAN